MLTLIVMMLVQAPVARAVARADACALLANEDVHRVLGVDVNRRQPVTQAARGLLSQCYLDTGTPRSVSIAVMMAKARKDVQGGEEPEADARRVPGIGDEAYWSGNRVAGALYVRRGDRLLRVSVGGIAAEPERIEKSRQLAVAALRRLPAR